MVIAVNFTQYYKIDTGHKDERTTIFKESMRVPVSTYHIIATKINLDMYAMINLLSNQEALNSQINLFLP